MLEALLVLWTFGRGPLPVVCNSCRSWWCGGCVVAKRLIATKVVCSLRLKGSPGKLKFLGRQTLRTAQPSSQAGLRELSSRGETESTIPDTEYHGLGIEARKWNGSFEFILFIYRMGVLGLPVVALTPSPRSPPRGTILSACPSPTRPLPPSNPQAIVQNASRPLNPTTISLLLLDVVLLLKQVSSNLCLAEHLKIPFCRVVSAIVSPIKST